MHEAMMNLRIGSPPLAFAFANPIMLLGLLAIAIPVALHLWSRRNYVHHRFAAIDFLMRAWERSARRIQLEHVLLLGLRLLIVAIFVVALADPGWQNADGGEGTMPKVGNRLWVVAIDTSASMSVRTNGASRLEAGKKLVSQVVDTTQPDDAFLLLNMSGDPEAVIHQPVYDKQVVRAEVKGLTVSDGRANLLATLSEVRRLLERPSTDVSSYSQIKILFVSDMESNTWRNISGDVIGDLAAKLPANAQLLAGAITDEAMSNLAIVDVRSRAPDTLMDELHRFEVDLRVWGATKSAQQTVRMYVDEQWVREREVLIAHDQITTVSFAHRFRSPGEHVVRFAVDDSTLALDNHRSHVVVVPEQLDVLIVGGREDRLRSLEYALRPTDELQERIRILAVGPSRFRLQSLEDFDLIVIDNLPSFDARLARQSREYVQSGGAMLIGLGDLVDPDSYSRFLLNNQSLFPVSLHGLSARGDYQFDPLGYRHAILDPFRGFSDSGLISTPIWKYHRIELDEPNSRTEDRADHESVHVVMNFSSGDPALVERRLGLGRVALYAGRLTEGANAAELPPEESWSALEAWPSFLPLIQQTAQHLLKSRDLSRNVIVGESLQGAFETDSITVLDPLQRAVEMTASGRQQVWQYENTWKQGIYLVREDDLDKPARRFSVSPDPTESRLEKVSVERLPSPFELFVNGSNASLPPRQYTIEPRPYQWMLVAAIVLLVFECWLARRFGNPLASNGPSSRQMLSHRVGEPR